MQMKQPIRAGRLILTLAALILCALNSSAQVFTYTYEGSTIEYSIINNSEGSYTVQCTGVWDTAKDLIIPEEVTDKEGQTYKVTGIGNRAFYNRSSLTVTIPNSVTEIGFDAFCNCLSLTAITIPNSVIKIGSSAFERCSSLTSVTIPNSVTKIDNSTFSGCSSLTSVTIGNSVTEIGQDAFRDCSSLTSVTIPNSVTKIGDSAFSGCSSLTSVTIPNSVTEIGNYTFYDCSSLPSVAIPNSVTKIGDGAFYVCTSLTSVTIPNSVTEIGDSAFGGCNKLTAVYISDITAWCNISFGAYSANPLVYSHNLYLNGNLITDLIIPDSVTRISDYAFWECSSLTSVTIPNSVTEIGSSAFERCFSLTSVTIGNSVTEIGSSAFYVCINLKELTLPESVTEIGSDAFWQSGLTELTVLNPIPPTVDNDYAFSHPENIALYVPAESVELYRQTEPWSQFKSINAVDTAIEEVEVEADVAVSVCGAEIVVPEGSKIFDLKGRAMRATKLPAGVYIVRTPSGKTVKVTIAHP